MVTVCYNSAATVRRTLESVVAQTYKNVELIVIDGGSTDGTVEIVREFGARVTLISEKDRGLYDAMNKGWKKATGKYVHFLNSDDWYAHREVLSQLMAQVPPEAHAKAQMIHAQLDLIQASGRHRIMGLPTERIDLRYGLTGIHQPSVLFPRALFDQLDGFKIQYKISADYDLIRRFFAHSGSHFVPMKLVYMSDGGLSSQTIEQATEENMQISLSFGEDEKHVRRQAARTLRRHRLRAKAPRLFAFLKAMRDLFLGRRKWLIDNRLPLILFSSEEGSWIDQDEAILSQQFEVTRLRPGLRAACALALTRSPILVWFLSVRMMPFLIAPLLLRRPVYMIAGGFDVVDPRWRGERESKWKKSLRQFFAARMRRVMAVSEVTRKGAHEYLGVPEDKLTKISLGFSAPSFSLLPWNQRHIDVISIFNATDQTWSVKGFDVLVEVARLCSDLKFVHMGSVSGEAALKLKTLAPSNLIFLGSRLHGSKDFWQELNTARVLFQPSRFESFCAVAIEGALAGCHILVSDRGELPETVKGLGETFVFENIQEAAEKLILMAHTENRPFEWTTQQRSQAAQKYSLEERARLLILEPLSR